MLAHEVGHAFVSGTLTNTYGTISAIRYGDVNGSTTLDRDEDDYPECESCEDEVDEDKDVTKQKLLNEICVALGGRAGERVYLNEDSTGIFGDYSYVAKTFELLADLGAYGFHYSRTIDEYSVSEKWRTQYHRLLCKEVNKQYKRAIKIIKKNKAFGLYLIDVIHRNGDVLSSDAVLEAKKFWDENKVQLLSKYSKITIEDLKNEAKEN